MVKNSLSSTINSTSSSSNTSSSHCHCRRHHQHFGFRMLVVLFLVFITLTPGSLSAFLPETTSFPRKLEVHQENQGEVVMASQRNYNHQSPVDHHRPCASFSHEKPRSLCNDFMSRRAKPIPPPPSSPSGRFGSIDPRYGVEKRLVPSGPNPLHN